MTSRLEFAVLTARVVSAHVSKNRLLEADLIPFVTSVFQTLQVLADGHAPSSQDEGLPAVPIKKSLNSTHLICLVCGRRFKTLKRHLQSKHGLSGEDYRSKFGLGPDYPVVAPAYAGVRSTLARKQGLGRAGTVAKTKRKR